MFIVGGSSGRVPVYRLRRMDSSDKPWWLDDNAEIPEGVTVEGCNKPRVRTNYDTDEEKPWWLASSQSDVTEIHSKLKSKSTNDRLPPLEDRASPDGLEMPKVHESSAKSKRIFISSYSNIDDLLGGSACTPMSPLLDRIYHDSTPQMPTIEPSRM